jgi:serine/threonine protein kinase/tetratricopeptide (TPR) repeat protein
MESRSRTDDLAMTLVEDALRVPEQDRELYLREACGFDLKLFAEAWSYVQWEKRMQRFLLDPVSAQPESRPPFEPGQILIDRFCVIRQVAQGGMGIVWEAIDQKLDRRVALKCAKTGFGNLLSPEVRNAREISHPNVCKIFEIHTAFTVDGAVDFISMEFLEGETLTDRLRRGPIEERQARAIAVQLCAGLAEAHRNQLIHGDLKTNNVILTTDSGQSVRAVITDFGLTRRADAAAGLLGGTPAYMAPELWKGATPSVASDIYAFGVMLWELRYQRPPGDLGLRSSTLLLGERITWKPPTGRGRWDRIIARCIDPDPYRRFQHVTEIARAFGPSSLLKPLLWAAAMLALAAASGLVTYQRSTAPAETVQLALLPFSSTPDNAAVSERLLHNTAQQLAALKSSSHTRFEFISPDKVIRNRVYTPDEARVLVGASHALRATAEQHSEVFTVHAYLTDVRSGSDVGEWTAEYKPAEMRHAPTALAGLVTGTLHLPPPSDGATVNAAARQDYLAGLAALGRDNTVAEARRLLGRAVTADPDSALTWAGLAEAQRLTNGTTGDKEWLDQAAESVREAEKRNPDLPQVHSIEGLLKNTAGWHEQAVLEYLRAIELNPGSDDAYRRLGQTYEDNNQLDEALTAFRSAVRTGPQQYRNFRDLGTFYYERARYKEAIPYFRRAVELAPDEPRTLYGLGVAHLALGEFATAETELRSSVKLSETPSAMQVLGLALMYQGKDRDAIPHIMRTLNLGTERYLSWMNLGTAYRHLGLALKSRQAYRRGLELAEAEIAKNPRNGAARASLAYSCAQVGDRGRAESELVQALQQAPNDAETRFEAALTYEALGRRDKTLSVLAASPSGVVTDLGRWPDVADLHRDPRFLQLLTSRSGR